MNITHDTINIPLSAGEIAELFNSYLSNSASICVISYFYEKAQDPDIKAIIKKSLYAAKDVVNRITEIFSNAKHPIPKGFSMKDVNLTAQKLYSDKFMLYFVRSMARFGLTNYSEARACAVRADVSEFINECITSSIELINIADEILLNKGLLIKEPNIPIPDKIDFVEKQSFLSGFFGNKRPLNASEINRLYLSYQRNALGKAFMLGLCQTVKSKGIKDYLLRGKKISEDHMEVVSAFLDKEGLPVPPNLDSEVLPITEAIFSDKLIMFFVASLDALGLGITGISLSRVMRRDLALALTRIMSEIALYAEDGFNIMISNEWFERIPEAADRQELIGV